MEFRRQQMTLFPAVRALCNAPQPAGYRVELGNSDGEIWFKDEHGDAYHGAREYQPAPDMDGGL